MAIDLRMQAGDLCIPLLRLSVLQLELIAGVVADRDSSTKVGHEGTHAKSVEAPGTTSPPLASGKRAIDCAVCMD